MYTIGLGLAYTRLGSPHKEIDRVARSTEGGR